MARKEWERLPTWRSSAALGVLVLGACALWLAGMPIVVALVGGLLGTSIPMALAVDVGRRRARRGLRSLIDDGRLEVAQESFERADAELRADRTAIDIVRVAGARGTKLTRPPVPSRPYVLGSLPLVAAYAAGVLAWLAGLDLIPLAACVVTAGVAALVSGAHVGKVQTLRFLRNLQHQGKDADVSEILDWLEGEESKYLAEWLRSNL